MYSWLQLSEKKIENYVRRPGRSAGEKERVEILLEFEKFPTDYDMCMILLMITHLHISADANVPSMSTLSARLTHIFSHHWQIQPTQNSKELLQNFLKKFSAISHERDLQSSRGRSGKLIASLKRAY